MKAYLCSYLCYKVTEVVKRISSGNICPAIRLVIACCNVILSSVSDPDSLIPDPDLAF